MRNALGITFDLPALESPIPHDAVEIGAEMREHLLRSARAAACEFLRGSSLESLPVMPALTNREFGGMFVTFWRGALLRGCVGLFGTVCDLSRVVRDVTTSSLSDPRFALNPITLDELPYLTIEISVLSKLWQTDCPEGLIPGLHGVLIRRGGASGCFLPKVAVEYGWSAPEFLSRCCTMKANLAEDSWRESDAEVYLFTAAVFADRAPKLAATAEHELDR